MSTLRLISEMTLEQMYAAFESFPDADAPWWIQDDRDMSNPQFIQCATLDEFNAYSASWKAANPLT